MNILVIEHSKTIFKRLLKVRKALFYNVSDCPIAFICCFGNFVIWVASLKERNNILVCIR